MRAVRRHAVPASAGLAAALAAFAVVAVTTDGDDASIQTAGSPAAPAPAPPEPAPAPSRAIPPDFGERMSDAELSAPVDFLLATRHPR
jgi:hypothetical protein